MIEFNDVVNFFLQLEGPYRWYVIGSILIILTAIITHFIFKTLKWFVILASAAIIGLTVVHYFTAIDLLALLEHIDK